MPGQLPKSKRLMAICDNQPEVLTVAANYLLASCLSVRMVFFCSSPCFGTWIFRLGQNLLSCQNYSWSVVVCWSCIGCSFIRCEIFLETNSPQSVDGIGIFMAVSLISLNDFTRNMVRPTRIFRVNILLINLLLGPVVRIAPNEVGLSL